MAIITSANAANAIVKLIAADALPALVGNLVLGRLVNRDFEPALGVTGDTINVPLPPVLSANNIAEGGSVTAQAPSLGNAQIVLNTHAESTFQIPDVTKILAYPDLIATYMRPAVIAIAEKVENDLASLYPMFTANTALGGVSAMDEARIDSAETALFDQKMPNGPKFLIVSSTAYSQMRQIARFTEFQTVGPNVGDSPMITAELPGAGPLGANGRIKDFLVFRSQYVKKVSTTTFNFAMGRDAIGLVVRRLPQPLPGTGAIAEYAEMGDFGIRVVMSYQPNTLSQQFTVDVLYGAGILRNQFAVQVQSN
jgi:hypothetical protein